MSSVNVLVVEWNSPKRVWSSDVIAISDLVKVGLPDFSLVDVRLNQTQQNRRSGAGLYFCDTDSIYDCPGAQEALSARFPFPQSFWSDSFQKSNGFFNSDDTYDESGRMTGYKQWFKLLVKLVQPREKSFEADYTWLEMCFLTSWSQADGLVMFCFNTSSNLQNSLGIIPAVESGAMEVLRWNCHLLHAVTDLYDTSVWSMRDAVRSFEKGRTLYTQPNMDPSLLHEAARHTTHCTETLAVSQEVVRSMLTEHDALRAMSSTPAASASQPTHRFIQQRLHSSAQILGALRMRSDANTERLRNENSLALSRMSQRDSQAVLDISHAARQDSKIMRKVALLTFLFLPATFTSAIFSTTFFSFLGGQDSTGRGWAVSPYFWIYWVVTVPLTIILYAFWRWMP